jgi:hypothetical protein
MNLEFRLLRADEIDCRISTCNAYGVGLLLYKDARCDQNILDEKVGCMNWQRHHTRDNANCIVSIWDEDKKQWIEKEDTGTESFTEKEKGLASDSFKRACFNWGIGRELYTAPNMFVFKKDLKTLEESNGRWTCKDGFIVTDIQYIDKNIVYVKVLNTKTNNYIEFGTPAEEQKKQDKVAKQTVSETKVRALLSRMEKDNVPIDRILALYKVGSLNGLTENQYANINANWEKIKEMS